MALSGRDLFSHQLLDANMLWHFDMRWDRSVFERNQLQVAAVREGDECVMASYARMLTSLDDCEAESTKVRGRD